ncbi:hypothetical protein [Nocardia africana]|uniref:Uncharacterized protein n=1 Tax=Nocardia africana TaxID=134964 RepID=A0A378X2H6_9NOCA|nr:hypothetical protein [Nocardia africana]MCC3311508.1 hypothetical protein [Nocardia africana]SUA47227.1 Uncharacterised protein [Nocardia africana]
MAESLIPGALTGQTVHYRLSLADISEIGSRRQALGLVAAGPLMPGDIMPAVFVPTLGGYGLHVLLNGPDSHWVPFAVEGTGHGTWSWRH